VSLWQCHVATSTHHHCLNLALNMALLRFCNAESDEGTSILSQLTALSITADSESC